MVKIGKISSPAGRLNTVLLLFPCWLLLYYFKEKVARFLVYNLFSLPETDKLAKTLTFLIATFLKIYLLLGLIIFLMAMVRTRFPVQKTRRILMDMPAFPANIMAGILGVLTPFCSCSAVPMFISFLETGVPLGITFSFLLAAPLVNEVILIMLAGLFGLKIAFIYLLAGLFIAIISGFIIGKMQLEEYLPGWLLNFRNDSREAEPRRDLDSMIIEGFMAVRDVFSRTWAYILAGILIGSLIHGYVPDLWLAGITAKNTWYSLPLAVLTGIPLYACSASVAPVAFALVDKGMPLGTALAFIMAVAGLSLPEFIMLKKVLSVRLILIFSGLVFAGILLVGYLFNLIL
jgi:uncharacterized protein